MSKKRKKRKAASGRRKVPKGSYPVPKSSVPIGPTPRLVRSMSFSFTVMAAEERSELFEAFVTKCVHRHRAGELGETLHQGEDRAAASDGDRTVSRFRVPSALVAACEVEPELVVVTDGSERRVATAAMFHSEFEHLESEVGSFTALGPRSPSVPTLTIDHF